MDDIARALADALERALPDWVERCVDDRVRRALGPEAASAAAPAARAAGAAAGADLVPEVTALLEADIDAQSTTPLAVVRQAVRYPTRVLADLGVPPAARDAFAVDRFPDDIYDLTPASMGDLGDEVGEAAIAWGAAKAWHHKRRHGPS